VAASASTTVIGGGCATINSMDDRDISTAPPVNLRRPATIGPSILTSVSANNHFIETCRAAPVGGAAGGLAVGRCHGSGKGAGAETGWRLAGAQPGNDRAERRAGFFWPGEIFRATCGD
jgi:hypothetical protein